LTFPGVTAAGLARLDPAVGPAIATAPVQQAVAVGAPASFSVAATGAGLAYQWTKDGVAVPGANGSSLVLAAAQPADAGHYAVTVKNLFGSVTSAPVLLTGPGTAPVISALASAPVTVGATATLTVTATGATSYQWRKLGQPLSGATTATLTLPATALADAGLYDVLVYNGLTRTRSAVARLVVHPSGAIQNPLRVDRTFAGVLESFESYGQPTRILAQPDGSYYVAGNFTSVAGAFRFNLARFSATGVLDPAFAPEVSGGNINALARQADGKLLLVGDFHRVNGIECHHIARLNTDGSLDTTFVHGPGTGTQESLHAVAIQADQKILIGGELTDYGETSSLKRLARLNSDGTLDTAFNSVLQDGFNDTVRAIAVHTDGRIYVVGDFTQFNQSTSANHLVALNADGSRFALPGIEAGAFAAEQTAIPALGSVSGADGVELTSLIVQPDGKLVVGGNFATFRNATARYLVGLAADGSADPSFINGSGAEGTVTRLLRQPDGMIYATGYFNTFDSRNARLVRLTATGAFDRSYSFDGTPTGLALGAANDLLVVGDFQTYYDPKTETSAPRSRFARIDAAGALTSAQVTRWGSFEGYVQTIIPAPGGKWLVAGYFRRLAGTRVDYLARLNADGSLDSTFSTVERPFEHPGRPRRAGRWQNSRRRKFRILGQPRGVRTHRPPRPPPPRRHARHLVQPRPRFQRLRQRDRRSTRRQDRCHRWLHRVRRSTHRRPASRASTPTARSTLRSSPAPASTNPSAPWRSRPMASSSSPAIFAATTARPTTSLPSSACMPTACSITAYSTVGSGVSASPRMPTAPL
jgi:uncharacterized delta-60 repeat protein